MVALCFFVLSVRVHEGWDGMENFWRWVVAKFALSRLGYIAYCYVDLYVVEVSMHTSLHSRLKRDVEEVILLLPLLCYLVG